MPMSFEDWHHRFTTTLDAAADSVWKRFTEQMPESYFRDTELSTQLSHLHLLAAGAASGVEQDLVLRSPDGNTWTFLTNQSRPGQLGGFLNRLPADRPLTSARVFTSNDGHWVIDVFEFAGAAATEAAEADDLRRRVEDLASGVAPEIFERFTAHLSRCEQSYLKGTTPAIALRHFALLEAALESDQAAIDWESLEGETAVLRMVIEGSGVRRMFERVASYLGFRKIDIERAYLTAFGPSHHYLGFEIRGAQEQQRPAMACDVARLAHISDRVLELWHSNLGWSLEDSEILHYLISVAHQVLLPREPGQCGAELSSRGCSGWCLTMPAYHGIHSEIRRHWPREPIRELRPGTPAACRSLRNSQRARGSGPRFLSVLKSWTVQR